MATNRITITLEEQDLIDLHAVLLDEDGSAALEFVKQRIASRIPVQGTALCDSSRCNPYLFRPETPAGDD